MDKRFSVFSSLLALVLFSLPVAAYAASFEELSSQGYKTSKLERNKAGMFGWMLSKENSRYFCTFRLGLAYSGKNEIVSFSTSGRMFTLDRKAFEKHAAGRGGNFPQYEDLKAGRPRPDDVGSCRKLA
ncbi:hypothetical protein [Agrobacterium arsenijevicii]|uniref:DUF995 domain-containing protein n=1 Tax=Agrobacterium arsenijevicii TaxID=1585697 RepID=A0ABR5D9U9_9HYPH|nr:hypothetical protein RP75_07230 [Agrobacterium arsenijevicii]